MSLDKELDKSIEQMRSGSKDGFLVFFNKTFEYTYLWTFYAFPDSGERNDFLAEYYPYLLLHICDLPENGNPFTWIDSTLPPFFALHTGLSYHSLPHENPSLSETSTAPDSSVIFAAATVVWSRILKNVTFPEVPRHTGPVLPIVFAGCCAILLLLTGFLHLEFSHTQHDEIDEINQENLISSTDTEVEQYLNGTAPDAATDISGSISSGSTSVTEIDNSANAAGETVRSTEIPDVPTVETPVADTPAVPSADTPSATEHSPSVPTAGTPSVSEHSVSEPTVSEPSVSEPDVPVPDASNTDSP